MAITVDPDDTSYDLAELRLDNEVIICEDFDFEVSTENNTKTTTNSRDPYRYAGGKNEYSWSANGIAPQYIKLLRQYQNKRTNFPVSIYAYGDEGEYREIATLLHCRIESISPAMDDEGLNVDIEGIALGIKDPR